MKTKRTLLLSEPVAHSRNILATLLIAILTVSATSLCVAQNPKEIKKSEHISGSDIVRIENAHQDIEITTWNTPKLEVVVTVEVDTDKEQDAQKVYSFYDFSITRSGSRVVVSIDPFSEQVKNMNTNNGVTRVTMKNGETFTYRNLDVRVEVFTPKSNSLELESKFSDISLGDMEAPVKIEISSSDLKGNNLTSLELEAQFSDLLFNDIETAEVEIKSSELTINDLNTLDLEASFSEIEVRSVRQVSLELQSGELEIEEVQRVEGECAFSDISIEHLKGGISLEAQSTTLSIEEVSGSFEIELDCDFSTVEIDLDGQSFELDVEAQFSSVDTPEGSLEAVDQFGQHIQYEGIIGNKGTNSTVSIECHSCSVELN